MVRHSTSKQAGPSLRMLNLLAKVAFFCQLNISCGSSFSPLFSSCLLTSSRISTVGPSARLMPPAFDYRYYALYLIQPQDILPEDKRAREAGQSGGALSAFSHNSNRVRHSGMPASRTLTWIREEHFHGPACSRCAWLFRPSGSPTGDSLREMKENYLRRCNEEFAAHDCTQYPKTTNANGSVNQSRRSRDTEGRSAFSLRRRTAREQK
jgi:hypothetical protein